MLYYLGLLLLSEEEEYMQGFSLNHLTDTEFEQFCYDLLSEMKFINLNWRKGTGLSSSPADHGRDIECQHTQDDVDGQVYLETWFVECKHYQQGVPPDKIQGALAWASAERPDKLLIIASNFLSNPTKDHLESYVRNNRPTFRIKYWEKPDLERLSRGKIELLRKYKIIDLSVISDYRIAEDIFIIRLETFEDMLLRVALKMGIDNISKNLLTLTESWEKFAKKVGAGANKYTPSVHHIVGAGLTYAYGDSAGINFKEMYTTEELIKLAQQLENVILFIDAYAQMNNILIHPIK